MAIFGERLRQVRKERNLTQNQLASELGMPAIVIQQYERGVRRPAHDAIITISKYLQISSDWLLGLSDERVAYLPKTTAETALPIILTGEEAVALEQPAI